ncbi:MAG: dephospho-CoA kinase [Proteobacteria bacterium]|uniref:Dephospho-CoA kinase n=1 Tax=Candidatus Avisuccinivibrio stercorigallinarum TaxID=2840704 RepID=A0A9D9GV36_9GAMM|nr:dephospho-CoA kinase [Candidatus Avisuccinivibrio stercorigallinarum]
MTERSVERFKVGLTGGIACGKTSACKVFAELQIPIVDADVISRELTSPGSPLLDTIAAEFGSEVIAADGSFNRKAMRNLAFSDSSALMRLNAIMHPAIHAELKRQALKKEPSAPYVVLAIPLLFEHHLEKLTDRILVLDCSEDLQLARIMQRDGSSEQVARSIMSNQVSRLYRRQHADDLIDTQSGSLEYLQQEIGKLHQIYLQCAAQKAGTAIQPEYK